MGRDTVVSDPVLFLAKEKENETGRKIETKKSL